MTISCIIIEDESLAAEKLEGFIKRSPYLELREKFHSSLEGLKYIKENPVDLLFLDIQTDETSMRKWFSHRGMIILEVPPRKTGQVLTIEKQIINR